MKRTLPAVLGALLAVALVPAPPAPGAAGPGGREATAWILPSAANRLVARNAADLTTLSVVGIGLHSDGAGVSPETKDMRRLGRAGHRHGLATEVLVSNYSNRLGDFDPRALHRLLSHPQRIRQVAARMARIVRRGPWDGVNVDLERVRRTDAGGLVAFVTALQRALPAERSVSIDVSASSTTRGYRRHGYRLAVVPRQVVNGEA